MMQKYMVRLVKITKYKKCVQIISIYSFMRVGVSKHLAKTNKTSQTMHNNSRQKIILRNG